MGQERYLRVNFIAAHCLKSEDIKMRWEAIAAVSFVPAAIHSPATELSVFGLTRAIVCQPKKFASKVCVCVHSSCLKYRHAYYVLIQVHLMWINYCVK